MAGVRGMTRPKGSPQEATQWCRESDMLAAAEAAIKTAEAQAVEAARHDVNAFAEYVFHDEAGVPLVQGEHHREWHAFLDAHDQSVVFAPMETGKCEAAGSRVCMASGEQRAIEDIMSGESVLCFDPNTSESRPVVVRRAFYNGSQPILRLTMLSGRTLRVTENHRLFSVLGWREARHLSVNDGLAMPRVMAVTPSAGLSVDEATLLGLVVGDGSTAGPHVTFTNAETELHTLFSDLCLRLYGWTTTKHHELTVYAVRNGSSTGICEWSRKRGLFEVLSRDKRAPAVLFISRDNAVAAFIGAYFACDGHVNSRGHGSLELSSASRGLLEDTQLLLQRLGVVSLLRQHNVTCTGRRFVAWRLMITGGANLRRFITRVPVPGCKSLALQAMRLEPETSAHSVTDVVPVAWQKCLRRSLWDLRKAGLRVDNTGVHRGHHRSRVRQAADIDDNANLRRLGSDAFYWDFIESIEREEPQPTFGLEIADDAECYLSSGIVSHNSRQLCIIRPLWELGNNPNVRVAIISESFGQAQKWLLAIREHIENNERLHAVFPHLKPGKPWHDSHFNIEGRDFGQADFSFTAMGQQDRFLGARVDRLFCDDLCSLANTLTKAARDKMDVWLESTALSRVTKEGRVCMIGTAWDDDDVLHRCSSRATSNPETIRRHWPTLVHKIRRPDGTPLWPEQWPETRIYKKQSGMTPSQWARCYENEARDEVSARFKRKWIEDALLRGTRGVVLRAQDFRGDRNTHFIVGMDLAGGRKRGDLMAMVSVAVEPGRKRHVLAVESGHWQTPEAITRMAEHHTRYNPIFYVENVATQELFLQGARWLTPTAVRGHTTGRGEASLQFEAEHLAVELEQGMWSLPSVNGQPATEEVAALIAEILDYHPERHVGDRLAALLFCRAHADEGMGKVISLPMSLTLNR